MFEHRSQPVLPGASFFRRQLVHLALALTLTATAIAIGSVGYHIFEGYAWLDATYAASMILTGMGPVAPLQHDSAKVFVSVYAVFSGVVFLTTAGITLAPMVHRLLHRLHLEEAADQATG